MNETELPGWRHGIWSTSDNDPYRQTGKIEIEGPGVNILGPFL